MVRYVNLDNLNDITVRLIRFFNSVSFEDDDEKEQLAEIIHDLCTIEVIKELDAERGSDRMKVLKIINDAIDKFPVSVSFRGWLSEADLHRLEEECEVRCQSVYMDGTGTYLIRYVPH